MADLKQWLLAKGFGHITERRPLSGGDISVTEHITTSSGRAICVKQCEDAAADFFAAEYSGLKALGDTLAQSDCSLTVPACYGFDSDFIVLDYIDSAPRRGDYWQVLGRGLAAMHRQASPYFGFDCDNYCGLTRQINSPCQDGHQFFAEQRLGFQAQLALRRDLISTDDAQRIFQLGKRLPELIPIQPASLIHGDLWAGNLMVDANGQPMLIDPACYYGWAEAELAMTKLFGGFSADFYSAYQEVSPLEQGWEQRAPVYNIYHLLNHLNLFGGNYYQQAMSLVSHYL